VDILSVDCESFLLPSYQASRLCIKEDLSKKGNTGRGRQNCCGSAPHRTLWNQHKCRTRLTVAAHTVCLFRISHKIARASLWSHPTIAAKTNIKPLVDADTITRYSSPVNLTDQGKLPLSSGCRKLSPILFFSKKLIFGVALMHRSKSLTRLQVLLMQPH
jgi:hypothetical protein